VRSRGCLRACAPELALEGDLGAHAHPTAKRVPGSVGAAAAAL